MVTVYPGGNDVRAPSLSGMTDPALFATQFRAGLDVLATDPVTRNAQIHVSGLPAIDWLWNARRGNIWCLLFAWPNVPCEKLLDNPADDCAGRASRETPDTINPGDGPNCVRRKQFHAVIRDIYNPILHRVVDEYRASGELSNARYIDIFDVRFDSGDVNSGDCFHPCAAGHALIAATERGRTHWGYADPVCGN
jgi:hypothetical protein